MPKISLSDASLRSLRAPPNGQQDFWDKTLPGFGVRVSASGSKTFMLNMHNSRRSLGRYPLLSLAEARAEAKRMFAERTLGKARPQAVSFKNALADFVEEKTKCRRPRTVKTLKYRLTRHFSFSGQLAEYSHQEVARRLSRIPTNSEHDHALAAAKTFFTWAHNRRLIEDNPVRGLSPRGHLSRSRVLTDEEVRKIFAAEGKFADYVKLLLLTGLRRNELRQATLGDFLEVPAHVSKNHRQLVVPVGSLTRSLWKPFPNFAWSREKAALDRATGVSGYVLHDCRRTFAVFHQRIGTPLPLIERMLNHVSGSFGGVVGIYQRHSFLAEMQEAVEKYERLILSLLARR